MEFFNKTTLQWIPLCDTRFTERNAQVVCRQLGYDVLNVYVSYDHRYELHPGSLIRVWSWPEPLQVYRNFKYFKLMLFYFLMYKYFILVYWKRREIRRLSN